MAVDDLNKYHATKNEFEKSLPDVMAFMEKFKDLKSLSRVMAAMNNYIVDNTQMLEQLSKYALCEHTNVDTIDEGTAGPRHWYRDECRECKKVINHWDV